MELDPELTAAMIAALEKIAHTPKPQNGFAPVQWDRLISGFWWIPVLAIAIMVSVVWNMDPGRDGK